MLREDKEVLKTCVIIALSALLISVLFVVEGQSSMIRILRKENESLNKKVIYWQGALNNDKQIQDNSK